MKKVIGFIASLFLCIACAFGAACSGGGSSSDSGSSSGSSQGGQSTGSSDGSSSGPSQGGSSSGNQGGQSTGSSDGSSSGGSQSGNPGSSSGGSQGGSGGKVECDVIAYLDYEQGVLVLEGNDWSKVRLVIGVKEYPVDSPEINFKELGLREGEYAVEVYYEGTDGYVSLLDGYYQPKNDKEHWGAITFFDEDKRILCRYYIEEGYVLKDSDFPEISQIPGVTYRWETDMGVEVGMEVPGNLDVYLHATYTEYTLTYHTNGGTFFEEDYLEKYTVKEKVRLPFVIKEGYLFAGWYASANFDGARLYEVGGNRNYGNLTLYAKFEPIPTEVQPLVAALKATLIAEKVTIEGGGSEFGFDASGDKLYAYEKYNGHTVSVISQGYYYDYNKKIYYPFEGEYTILDILSLKEIMPYCDKIVFDGENGGVKYYSFVNEGTGTLLKFGVKDGKIVKVLFEDGYTVTLTVTYDCQKFTLNVDDFSAVKKVMVKRVTGLENEAFQEEIEFVDGQNIEDNPRIQNMMQSLGGEWQFKGFYSDEACTQQVTSYAELGTKLYLLYINPQTVIQEANIILRLSCHCSECDGKMSDYPTTIKELYEIGNRGEEAQDHLSKIARGDFYDVCDGYVMEGLFLSYGQYDETFSIGLLEQALREKYEQGKSLDGTVFGLYTKKREATTYTVTVKGFDEDIVKYVVEGGHFDWNFLFDYVPEGYVLKGLYDNAQFTGTEHGTFTDSGNWEVVENQTVYAKIIEDERVQVTVHFGCPMRASFAEGYFSQGQPESVRAESYTFKIFADEKLYHYLSLLNTDGGYEGKLITGYYYDEAYTQPVGRDDLPQDGDEIYALWGDWVEFTLHYVTGFNDTRNGYVGLLFENFIYDHEVQAQRNEDYISVMKFYSDEERTKEIFSVIAGDIYVGYKEVPHITIICPEGCTLTEEEHYVKAENGQIGWMLENHRSKTQAGQDNPIHFYYDEAFTRPVKPDDTITDSVTIYGKEEHVLRNYLVHCGCLKHGANGVQIDACNEQDAMIALNENCDFGRRIFTYHFFISADRTQGFSFYTSNDVEGVNEVWLQKFTLVYVYADYDDLRADGKMLVDSIYDVLEYFYLEETADGLGFTFKDYYEKRWVMYTDDSYTVARALPYEYELTANEKFYFREETYNSYENLITIKANGYDDYAFYTSAGINGATSVDRSTFGGFRTDGLYLDAALTIPVAVGKEIDSGIRLNWNVTLYAKLGEMPIMTIYAAVEDSMESYLFHLNRDETYSYFLWYFLQNEDLYSEWKEGKVLELCRNADGTGVVDLSKEAEAGEYYFRFNDYSLNNVKITFSGVIYNEDNFVYETDWEKIGKGNFFYLEKGGSFADVEKIMQRMILGVPLGNGQSVSLGMRENGTNHLDGGIKVYFYLDEACTQKLTATSTFNADATIYVKVDLSEAETLTVHLGDKGSLVFYTGDMSLHRLISYLGNVRYDTSISLDIYEQYPALFAYGAITGVFTDSNRTEEFTGSYNQKNVYCTIGTLYGATVYYPDGRVYARQLCNQALTLSNLFGTIEESCETKYGHTAILATDREGNNRVNANEYVLEGNETFYIVYVRHEGIVEVKVVCSCGNAHTDCEVWLTSSSMNEVSENHRVGNGSVFYVQKGTDIQALLRRIADYTHGLSVEYYSDAAMTQKITDFTVDSDTTVYIKVVEVIA